MPLREGLSTIWAIINLALEKKITFLAGSIAFFAFVSIVPAMVLVLAVGSLLGGERFAAGIVSLVEGALSEEGAEVLETALADTTGLAGASVIGIFVLFWSTLKVFRALDIAFDRIYQVEATTSLPRNLLNGTIVILSIMTSLMVLLLVRTTVNILSIPYANLLSLALVLLSLIAVLTPVYYVMPPIPVTVRSIIPGALAAVVGLVLLHQLFHVYAGQADQFEAYGFIGAVLLFLLWLYFGATILLGGVVINASLLERRKGATADSDAELSLPVTPHLDDQTEQIDTGDDVTPHSEEEEPPKIP